MSRPGHFYRVQFESVGHQLGPSRAERGVDSGLKPAEALAAAAVIRLRPILMTTLATAAGLLPLALGYGAGAKMQQPLAVAVIGGLVMAMLLSSAIAGG